MSYNTDKCTPPLPYLHSLYCACAIHHHYAVLAARNIIKSKD